MRYRIKNVAVLGGIKEKIYVKIVSNSSFPHVIQPNKLIVNSFSYSIMIL